MPNNKTKTIEPDTSTTLASWGRVISRAIADRGIDSERLLMMADINPQVLSDPEGRIPVSKLTRLWKLATEATKDESFGLSVPHFLQPTSFHALGFSLMVSSNLREAWQRARRYYKVVSDVLDIEIEEYDNESALCYVRIPGKDYADEAIDAFMTTMIKWSEGIVDAGIKPVKIEFERPEPKAKSAFEAAFPCPLVFAAGRNRIFYRNEDLDRPLASANREIAIQNDEVVQRYLSRLLKQSLAKQVTEKMIALLAMGDPNQDIIADQLHISSRHLQRKLKDENTSFRQLLENVKKDLAQNYLAASQLSIIEIAYQLGFQDPSNFTRAFKRWFGVSPSTFRQTRARSFERHDLDNIND